MVASCDSRVGQSAIRILPTLHWRDVSSRWFAWSKVIAMRPLLAFGSTTFLVLATMVCGLETCAAQQKNTLPADKQAKIASAMQRFLKDSETPSAQIGIIEHGKIVYLAAFGEAQLEPPVEATTAMPYGIGSVSKQFTAAAVMVLVEQGKIKLDDPVSTWFPDLAHSREITLRNLLNQVSGYEDFYTEDYPIPQILRPVDSYQFAKEWTGHSLNFTPGSQYQYSNTNYLVVALIVQKVAGMPFFDFLQQSVLRPAGLTHVVNLEGQNVPQVPQGYQHFAFGPPRPAPAEGKGTLAGSGQLAMPIGDLMLWDNVVMHRSAVLKPASWDTLETPFVLPSGKGTGYGMGFTIDTYDGLKVVGHTGGLTGFVALEEMYPELDAAVAIVSSSDRSGYKALNVVRTMLSAAPTTDSAQSDTQGEALLKAALDQLGQGHIDRNILAPNLDFYLTPQAIADYKFSLAPFGTITKVDKTSGVERGGMHGLYFDVTGSSGKHLRAFIYVTRDGKLDQLVLHKS